MTDTVKNSGKNSASDITYETWVDRLAPRPLQPYLHLARLDRPIGTWLLLLPCWWSVALATSSLGGGWPDPVLMALFAVGAVVMRGAGCTVNDLADHKFDARVARTQTRPLPSGRLSRARAVIFLGLLLLTGLGVLAQFNTFAVVLGMASLGLVAVYPFMKRFTYWPQLVLGFTFNWGALLGWAAVQGHLALAPGLLYVAGIFWTLGYDTIYAHQDKEDDILIGVKSTALKFGDATVSWLILFYGFAVLFMLAAGLAADVAWPYYAGLALAALHLVWQVATVDIDDAKNCLARFKSNRDFGLIVLAGIVVAGLI